MSLPSRANVEAPQPSYEVAVRRVIADADRVIDERRPAIEDIPNIDGEACSDSAEGWPSGRCPECGF
jgi:hypothetical protein